MKLCDVFPDGTSALVTRGSWTSPSARLEPVPLVPGEEYDVTLLLDACAYRPDPGHRLRLSVAGADWPNTIAPPAPVTLTVHGGSVDAAALARRRRASRRPSRPGAESSSEDADDVDLVDHPRRAAAHDDLRGPQRGDVRHPPRAAPPSRTTPARSASTAAPSPSGPTAETTFRLTWPGIEVRVVSTLRVDIGPDGYDVVIDADAFDGGEHVGHREWRERFARRSG